TAGLRRAPRLSLVANLGSPLAIGIRQPEIVIPQRALDQLTAAQQDAMLAHELAHHIRRDALWQALTRVIGGVFFFQPLHALARRRLHESAELLSDAWAVEHTGCSRSLAECLTVVAGWVVGAPRSHPAPAMAAHGSMLTQRVERLVDHDLPTSAPRARVLLCVVAFLPLLAVVLAAPAVATAAAVPAAMPLADPMARPVVSPRPDAPATLEYEITLLEDEITTLLALLAQVEEPPAALRVAAARLQTRLEALKLRRPALAGAPSKEMPR
ncbi:MAG: M56 family metallopeptidase, partial [Planctomycetota bacterium]|nr:M56 family metallopeptidase [Planctomycetota bacterium]